MELLYLQFNTYLATILRSYTVHNFYAVTDLSSLAMCNSNEVHEGGILL